MKTSKFFTFNVVVAIAIGLSSSTAAPCEFNNNIYENRTVIYDDLFCDACVCFDGDVYCTKYWNEDIPCEMADDQQSTSSKSSSKLKAESSKSLPVSLDAQCPADMTCQIMTSDCLLQPDCDNELHVCRANSKLQTIIEESTPCYGRTTGTSDNCGVMEIVFDHSAITESETLAVLCKDLGEYLKEELRQFPECSAVNCEIQPDSQRLSSRDRRQDIEPLTVKIEVEIKPPSVKSSSTNNYMLDLMAAIETILQEGIDNGELPGDLGAVQEVFLMVDGGWSEPHPLTPCNVTCGGPGWQILIRNCTNPPPSNGGADCEGDEVALRPCFEECTTAAPTVKPNTEGNVWMKLVVLSITAVLILLIAILLLYVRRWNQKKKADRAAQHAEENAFNGIGRSTVRNTRDLADRLSITPSEMASFDNAGYNYQDGTSTGHLGAVVAWPDYSNGTAPSENIYATIRYPEYANTSDDVSQNRRDHLEIVTAWPEPSNRIDPSGHIYATIQ